MTRWILAAALLIPPCSARNGGATQGEQDEAAVKKVVLVELFTSQG